MPPSMPRPARRIGTTSGSGVVNRTPRASWIGVRTVHGSTRTLRVASYANRVTSSSVSWRKTGDAVEESRSRVSLCATRG
ncbi:hypothetical protein SDC9_171873 [bioreactor metagenome]|uniref:Uncharacterized protein n=1 Tax=bioreactor metagenome TaxID=1076179 RepID=A0A645GKK4_9ZZZZ